jgi:hypothetical protein
MPAVKIKKTINRSKSKMQTPKSTGDDRL